MTYLNIPTKNDFKAARDNTGLTQEEFSKALGVSQSTVSRIEKEDDPKSITLDIIVKWFGLSEKLRKDTTIDFETETPWSKVSSLTEIVESHHLKAFPERTKTFDKNINTDNLIDNPEGAYNHFIRTIKQASTKPSMSVIGRFDAGKSTLLNTLLGSDILPEKMQPSSSAAILIKSLDDRPEWHTEDVSLYSQKDDQGRKFNFSYTGDADYHTEFKVLSGSVETIKNFTDHQSKNKTSITSKSAEFGIAYYDSDILKALNLLDTPGFCNNDHDNEKATIYSSINDILVYCSSPNGFMNEFDFLTLSAALHKTPIIEGAHPLDNIYILLTNADKAGGRQTTASDEIPGILDTAAKRAFIALEKPLKDREKASGIRITEDDVRSRFFAFSAESLSTSNLFLNDLKNLAGNLIPTQRRESIKALITSSSNHLGDTYKNIAKSSQNTIENHEQASEELKILLASEPTRKKSSELAKKSILRLIESLKESSNRGVLSELNRFSQHENLEQLIREKFDSKKDAKISAPSYLSGIFESTANDIIKKHSEEFSDAIEDFLSTYDVTRDLKINSMEFSGFTPQGALISSIAGLGSVGALSLWAGIVAGGSNLGSYILLAKVVSFLSSIGIPIGSTATVAAFVASIGGPITLAVTLGLIVTGITYTLLGKWQKGMAKSLSAQYKSDDFMKQLSSNIDEYWDDTARAFNVASEDLENDFENHLQCLKAALSNINKEGLLERIEYANHLADFYHGVQNIFDGDLDA